MRLVGRVVRMGKRKAYRILMGSPDGKRPLGRPRIKSEDNTKMDVREIEWRGVDCIRHAQDIGPWRALVNTLPGRWIGRRSAIVYPPRSSELTPLDFYLWRTLKDEGYRQKPATLNALREIIEASCAGISPDTLTAVVRSAVRRHRRCLAVDGGHFEHIQ
ncbi:hypothetical protein B7P43_G11340 [Cryptotermes secundus]|uniref:Tc1-like transposase DDE domain-containing protein n=1 Tax=Cryptotermes secundus TaxID=105785 RepID=A0A2J7RQ64_9NEOP|nr:hypothetical protein B7P43_G11340 [Cryptotermes secundus]